MKRAPRQLTLSHWFLIIVILPFAFSACQLLPRASPLPGSTSPPLPSQEAPSSASWYTIFFTDPSAPSSKTYRGGPDQDLAQAIRRSRLSVDVAVLQLNLWSIRDALLDAHRRGIRVRMVTDSDYLDEDEVQSLIDAGIPVIADRRESTMHNKFVVIDQFEVWTGSMNFTVSETYRNNNTLLRIRSSQLAQNYTTEFEEMFLDDHFGSGSPPNTPNPQLTIDGVTLQSCFSPDDRCIDLLTAAISAARQRIVFMAYSFTSDDLADALIDRRAHGVDIQGVMESSQVASNIGTDFEQLLSSGIDIRLDSNPAQMHEKVIVIDGNTVAVGSFNFTYSAATRNDENLLLIHDPAAAALYLEEFERLFAVSRLSPPTAP